MDDELDKQLRQAASTASRYCFPQLHVISFSYAPVFGWRCLIQESRFVSVCVGVAAKPSMAFNEALRELVDRRSQELDEKHGHGGSG